ncbi:hypothetical protein BN1843_28050 [Escherichia coli]|nr:hypothetical protein BN1843_28050 [Escherichia coli]
MQKSRQKFIKAFMEKKIEKFVGLVFNQEKVQIHMTNIY